MNRRKFFQQSNIIVMLVILILVEVGFSLGGCANNPSATFRNPRFRCPSRDVVEPKAGYPFPVQRYPLPGREMSVRELKSICERMEQRFDDSNLTIKEAEAFYALLKANNETRLPGGQSLFFSNGTYGFPTGPGDPFVFEKQVRLKKLSEEKYEIFYYHIDCGRNYTHMELYLEDGELIGVEKLASWAENYPC